MQERGFYEARLAVAGARAAARHRRQQLIGQRFDCGDGDGMWQVLDVFREDSQWLVAYARVADLDAGAVAGAWVQRGAGSGGGGEQVIADMVGSSSQEEVEGWIVQYRKRLVVNARSVVED